MKSKAWILAAAFAGVGVLLLTMVTDASEAARTARAKLPARAKEPASVAELPPHAGVPATELAELAAPAASPIAPVAPAAADALPTPAPGESVWVARVLQLDGQPAAGVPWVLESEWTHDGAYARAGKTLPRAERGVTDALGRAIARVEPLDGCLRELRVEPAGLLGAHWTGEEHQPGIVRDLGAVTLGAGGTIAGRVTLAGGGALPADVRLWARAPSQPRDPLTIRPERAASTATAAPDGRFLLERVPTGRVLVEVEVPGASQRAETQADVSEGAITQLDLVAPDVDPAVTRRVVLSPRGESGWGCEGVAPESVSLRTAGGVLHPRPLTEGEENLCFDDLEPGEYLIDVDDPAWLPQQLVARTGVWTDMNLVGASTLELRVTDAGTGEPVTSFGVRAQAFRDDQWHDTPSGPAWHVDSSWWDVLAVLGEHAGGRVSWQRLPAHAHRLRVEAPGFESADVAWLGVPRGQHDTLTVQLQRSGRITGVVVDADGAPQASVRVGLFQSTPPGQTNWFLDNDEYWSFAPSQGLTSEILAETLTDVDGRFTLDGAPGSLGVVRAWRSAACDVTSGVLELGPPHEPLQLVLPSAGELAGRVVLPAAVPATRLTIFGVSTAPLAAAEGVSRRRAPLFAQLDEQGHFRLEGTRPGPWSLWLTCSPVRLLGVGGGEPASAGDYARWLGNAQVPLSEELVLTPAPADTPGLVSVRVEADGLPASGLKVLAMVADQETPLAAATAAADGLALLGPMWPREVTVSVQDAAGAWGWPSEASLHVPPGGIASVELAVSLAPRTMRMLDTTSGAPRAGVVIAIWHHAANGWAWRVQRTAADGRMMLMVPSGEVRAMLAPDGDLLVPLDGETWEDFLARRAAAGRKPALQPSELPASPPNGAVLLPWRPGASPFDVRL